VRRTQARRQGRRSLLRDAVEEPLSEERGGARDRGALRVSEPELRGADDAGGAEAPSPTAGALLAQARHAAGLTVDGVASQLKLAPRQVVAIERDDFGSLPGRTFVRGFVRNYARLLKLDVDAVLAALPGEGAAPALERPTLGATSRAIGELPSERTARPSIARWAIPLALAAIVAVAAYYE